MICGQVQVIHENVNEMFVIEYSRYQFNLNIFLKVKQRGHKNKNKMHFH